MALQNSLNSNSKFWLDRSMFQGTGESVSISKKLKLLAYKRAISNFVKILTQKDGFVVKFSSGNDSYTDGKTVVISSKLDENNFDLTVGLALHEASHLLLTDFKWLGDRKNLEASMGEHGLIGLDMRFDVLHKIHNIVEDRYIDSYVYRTAPGYRGYYQTLYNHYFKSPKLAKLLKSKKRCTETVDNYIDQLLNIVGLEFDPNRMIALADIVKELDIQNIDRLKTTKDRLDISTNIYAIILKQVETAKANNINQPTAPNESENNQSDAKPEKEKSKAGGSDNEDNDIDDIENDKGVADEENLDLSPAPKEDNDDGDELSDKEQTEAEKILSDASNMVNGKVKKDSNSAKLNDEIEMLDIADVTMTPVKVDLYKDYDETPYDVLEVNTLLVKHINSTIASSNMFNRLFTHNGYIDKDIQEVVAKGVVLGNMLAKRMQVRNEERTFISNRLKSGKIFNRHIALLGADVENIFYKTKTDKFKKSVIHISIDASGSMMGTNFNNSILTATAIAKACTFLKGVSCIISFRSQYESSPMMVIAYNSKKDHFSKILDIFPRLYAAATTPEGLCYEAYLAFINEEDSGDVDKFVINLSDGEPCFQLRKHTYTDATGEYHTKKVWNAILKSGVVGLSYFIGHNVRERNVKSFKFMYGKDAKFVEPGNIVQLATTVNEMLMSGTAVYSTLSE